MQTPGWMFELNCKLNFQVSSHHNSSNQLVFHRKLRTFWKKQKTFGFFMGAIPSARPMRLLRPSEAFGLGMLIIHIMHLEFINWHANWSTTWYMKHKNIVDLSWFIDMQIHMQDAPKKDSNIGYLLHESPALKTHWICWFSTCHTFTPQEAVLRSWLMDEVVPSSSV